VTLKGQTRDPNTLIDRTIW